LRHLSLQILPIPVEAARNRIAKTGMELQQYRKSGLLCALIAIAGAYSFWFHQRQVVTGNPTVDGTLSVLLGLYICSRPAGNAIDLFFF
jgi:hypothetical protein